MIAGSSSNNVPNCLPCNTKYNFCPSKFLPTNNGEKQGKRVQVCVFVFLPNTCSVAFTYSCRDFENTEKWMVTVHLFLKKEFRTSSFG